MLSVLDDVNLYSEMIVHLVNSTVNVIEETPLPPFFLT